MKLLTTFLISVGLSTANPVPLEIISSRPLDARDLSRLNERTLGQCPSAPGVLPPTLSPTLMVPISKKLPNIPFGGTQTPNITPNDFCTIFNLEIPATAVGKTCTLEFLFPNHEETLAPYVYQGGGHFTFTGYAYGSGASAQTTYNKQPPAGPNPPSPPAVLAPGNAYLINAGPCGIQPGQTQSVTVSGALCSPDTTLTYLQSKDLGCPIGFYVALS